MKVSDQNAPIQLDAYIRQVRQQHQKKPDPSPGLQGGADKVQLSDQARQIQPAVQEMSPASEIREDKVREIKMAVAKGTYKVVGDQVATHMLKEAFENDIILHKINMRA